MITLRNSFHNTECQIKDRWGDNPHPMEAWDRLNSEKYEDKLAKKTIDRIHSKLCGSNECMCGTVRGKQN